MKKLFCVMLTTLALVACGDDGGGGGQTAVSPLELQCINGQANCPNNGYNQYPGWSAYPYAYNNGYNYVNYFAQNGFCNCPYGSIPAYNGTMGLGCVRNTYIQPYVGAYFYWNFGNIYAGAWGGAGGYPYYNTYTYPGYNYPNNYPQFSNVNAYQGPSCTQNLAQSCYLNVPNSCGGGLVCRPTAANSNLGICTQ
ncbi:hypothetical protein [Bdellovibrio sp. HCB2-146]|uniref:hypothetical protein n=1 Tax=Bdellovibrio sp. HCB2-146 TaxID=3394362 RepID=UPI0039BCFAD3